MYDREQLAKSNEYYHQIHPTEAASVDARLAEAKAKADAKATAVAIASAVKAAEIPAKPAGGGV
jgi:NADH-quinone oxidoreductase subunit I